MKYLKPVLVLAVIAFGSSVAVAGEGKTVSYSMKKQGRVHFQDKKVDEVAAQQGSIENVDPANIEPAAGDFEPVTQDREKSLADSMRLPRKN